MICTKTAQCGTSAILLVQLDWKKLLHALQVACLQLAVSAYLLLCFCAPLSHSWCGCLFVYLSVQEVMDKIALLLEDLNDKDFFFNNYRSDLAKRLLNPAVSDGEELLVLSKFKVCMHPEHQP